MTLVTCVNIWFIQRRDLGLGPTKLRLDPAFPGLVVLAAHKVKYYYKLCQSTVKSLNHKRFNVILNIYSCSMPLSNLDHYLKSVEVWKYLCLKVKEIIFSKSFSQEHSKVQYKMSKAVALT